MKQCPHANTSKAHRDAAYWIKTCIDCGETLKNKVGAKPGSKYGSRVIDTDLLMFEFFEGGNGFTCICGLHVKLYEPRIKFPLPKRKVNGFTTYNRKLACVDCYHKKIKPEVIRQLERIP